MSIVKGRLLVSFFFFLQFQKNNNNNNNNNNIVNTKNNRTNSEFTYEQQHALLVDPFFLFIKTNQHELRESLEDEDPFFIYQYISKSWTVHLLLLRALIEPPQQWRHYLLFISNFSYIFFKTIFHLIRWLKKSNI